MKKYMILWRTDDLGMQIEYIEAHNTQEAVDTAREYLLEEAEIIEQLIQLENTCSKKRRSSRWAR